MNRPLPECSNLRPLSIWRLVRWPLSLLLLFPSIALSASEDDLATKRGQETEVQLPPFPQAENLIPFVVSAMTDNKFMIDGESLTVSTDGIVRYTLVIISSAGAQNVSYEAIVAPPPSVGSTPLVTPRTRHGPGRAVISGPKSRKVLSTGTTQRFFPIISAPSASICAMPTMPAGLSARAGTDRICDPSVADAWT